MSNPKAQTWLGQATGRILATAAHPGTTRTWTLRWILSLGVLALCLAYLPWLLARCCGPAGLSGLGTFWFINDFAQYESAMQQGASGASWLVYNRFTSEVHTPALMFSLYVGLGKLSVLSGLSTELLLGLTELVSRLGLLVAVGSFFIWLLGWGRSSVLAFALSIFAMGLGMPAAVIGALAGSSQAYTGNGSYEVNTFGLLFSAPHASLALALTLALPPAFEHFGRRPGLRRGAVLVATSAGLALLHPFHLPPLLGSLAALAWLRWRAGWRFASIALSLVLVLAACLPFALYAAATFNLDPFWGATYREQNVLPSPTPAQLPIDFGVLLALAIPGAMLALREPSACWRWLLIWIAAMLVAMYAPVPYQRRLGFGLQPALAALAAPGFWWAWDELWRRGRPQLAKSLAAICAVLATLTTATAMAGIAISAVGNEPMRPYRATAGEVEAASWLSQVVAENDRLLADWDTSNYLAGRVPARVLGGHPVATLRQSDRRQELATFFGLDAWEQWRFVRENGVTHIFHGPREKALGSLEGRGWLRTVYDKQGVIIYVVDDH